VRDIKVGRLQGSFFVPLILALLYAKRGRPYHERLFV
jgi:hypothetical protein